MFEHALLIVRRFVNQFFCQFLEQFVPVASLVRGVILLQDFTNLVLAVFFGQGKWCFAFLVLDTGHLLAETLHYKVDDLVLAVACCYVEDVVSEFVLLIDPSSLITYQDVKDFERTHLSCYEDWRF